MSDSIATRIQGIVAEQAMVEPSDVTAQSTPESLGLDSLAMVEIVFAVEEAFGIEIPYNANDPAASDFDFTTVGTCTDGVRRLVAAQR